MNFTISDVIINAVAGMGLGWMSVPHCFSMCGPLHLSICATSQKGKVFKTMTLFNIGRLIGYAIAGVIFGYIGVFVNTLAGCPSCASKSTAGKIGRHVAYLIPAAMMFYFSYKSFRKSASSGELPGFISKYIIKFKNYGLLGVGCATTLLPCGVLYLAFAKAAGTASPVLGAIVLLAFCIPITFSLELGILIGHAAGKKMNIFVDKLFPWLTLFAGIVYVILFIVK